MVSPLLVIGEAFESHDEDGTNHITFATFSSICDDITNSALDMNDKTVLFAQLPDGNYQALLEDMQKTMPIQEYEGTPSLLLADYLSRLYEHLEAEQHTQMKTMLEQARVIEELNSIMEQHVQEISILRESLDHETRQRQKLQKENMILNEKRKIEKEHFEQEIQLLTDRIGKLVQEKEDLLTQTTHMEEEQTSQKDTQNAETIKQLRDDVLNWRKQCRELEGERDSFNKKYLMEKKDKEAILLELEFKAQLLEETEEMIGNRKREHHRDMEKLLDEHKTLVQMNKNLELDLRSAQRQLQTELKVRKDVMVSPSLASTNTAGSNDPLDDEDLQLEPSVVGGDGENKSPRATEETPSKTEFVIVKSYMEDDVEDSMKKDIAETEPILKGSLLSALGEDDLWFDEDEDTLIKTLHSDKDLTKEKWRQHRRTRSEVIEKKQNAFIGDMLARAQSVATRAKIELAPESPRSKPDYTEDFASGTSMAEILEAVNVVRSELIKETKTIHATLLEQVEKKNQELQYKNVELQSQLEIYFKMLTDERQKRETQVDEERERSQENLEKLLLRVESLEKQKEGFESKIAELKDELESKEHMTRDVENILAKKDLEISETTLTLERELALKESLISDITHQKLTTVMALEKENARLRSEIQQIAIGQQKREIVKHERRASQQPSSLLENLGLGDLFQ